MKDASTGLPGVLGPLVLLACFLALLGCESQPGRAQEADEDPFRRLDPVRVTTATPAPAFTVPSLAAGPLSLADFRGRVVLLNFWATRCPPCREDHAVRTRSAPRRIVALTTD